MSNKSLAKLLPYFNPDDLPPNPFIFFCASRRAGKSSVICNWLLNHFQDVDYVIGLMGNPHTARHYTDSGAIPAKYCHTKYSPEILKRWFEKSEKLLKKGETLPRVLFVCDDILVLHAETGKRTTRQDPYLNRLATQGRHWNAGTILCVQSWNLGLQYIRNSDLCCTFPQSLYAGQDFKNLADTYMSADNYRENREILALFKKYDLLCLRYWMASRSQKDLLAYYRVNKQSLPYVKY